jgi:hypothetical protein
MCRQLTKFCHTDMLMASCVTDRGGPHPADGAPGCLARQADVGVMARLAVHQGPPKALHRCQDRHTCSEPGSGPGRPGARRAAGRHQAADDLGALPGEDGRAAPDQVQARHADPRQHRPPVQLRAAGAPRCLRCPQCLCSRPAMRTGRVPFHAAWQVSSPQPQARHALVRVLRS